jgi:hypothetical protein
MIRATPATTATTPPNLVRIVHQSERSEASPFETGSPLGHFPHQVRAEEREETRMMKTIPPRMPTTLSLLRIPG